MYNNLTFICYNPCIVGVVMKKMNDLLKKEQKILEVVADIYIFAMVLIFPLMVDKTGFFHILECKWYSYVTIASSYVGINILVILYFLIFKKVNCFKSTNLSVVHWLLIGFLVINIISCFCSPFFSKYNLFIGVGRGEGLIMMSLYSLSFLSKTWIWTWKNLLINNLK